MSKLGIASDAGLGLGPMWSSLNGSSTGHHRNGLVKKRSYSALERCPESVDPLSWPRLEDSRTGA